jgi:hypothetical protein
MLGIKKKSVETELVHFSGYRLWADELDDRPPRTMQAPFPLFGTHQQVQPGALARTHEELPVFT